METRLWQGVGNARNITSPGTRATKGSTGMPIPSASRQYMGNRLKSDTLENLI